MLVTEALLLLLLDEEKGRNVHAGYAHDAGLAGALLLDLTAAGLLDERSGTLVTAVGSQEPPSPPALAAAWRAISAEQPPRSAKGWLGELPKRLKPLTGTIAAPLVERGVLGEERHKRLGLFATTRYPERDPEPERALRARLRSVLVDGAAPDAFTAALLALVVPMDLVKPLVAREERKAANARAKAVAEQGAVGDAVRSAVEQQIMAAVAASVAAAAAATTTVTTAAS